MLYLALACAPGIVGEPSAVVSDAVATVIIVEFETTADVAATVEFGETTELGHSSRTTTGTTHRHVLLGMPSGTEVHWRIVLDGEPLELSSTNTELLPTGVPELTTVEDAATWEGYLFTTMVGLWQGPVVLDSRGRIVWYFDDTRDETAVIRAAPKLDGGGVAYNMIATMDKGDGEIDSVNWDGVMESARAVPGESHDFLELEDDHYATIQIARVTDDEGELIIGDRLIEVYPGSMETVWDSFDWLDPYTTGVERTENSWTHANTLHWYPDEGVYRMGLRNLETIVTIDGATGEPVDYFGGEVNTGWTFIDDERPFSYQHNFDWLGDRVVIFDNGDPEYDDTRVVEYSIDAATKTATKTWSYHFDPPRWIYALGDVERLEDESTLISWSIAGRLEQVKDDETIWRVEAPVGSGFGYLYRVDSLYGD
jgi:Arylsulfotransferase (ASST)